MSFITPEGVLSYPKVFRSELPHNAKPGDKKAWSTTILFTAAALQSEEFKALVAEALKVARERFGSSVASKIEWVGEGKDKDSSFVRYTTGKGEGTLRMPFRRDTTAKGYPAEFVMFLAPRKVDDPDKNIRPPEVIDRAAKPVTDPREIYPGVRARISLGVFAYDSNGNRGVSFGLNNIQKLGDGPRIDNAKDAKDEFGALEPADAADMPSDLASFAS